MAPRRFARGGDHPGEVRFGIRQSPGGSSQPPSTVHSHYRESLARRKQLYDRVNAIDGEPAGVGGGGAFHEQASLLGIDLRAGARRVRELAAPAQSVPRICCRAVGRVGGGFFVDDGSSDGSEEILGEMAERADRRITAVPLRGGFGKSAADPPGSSLHEVS